MGRHRDLRLLAGAVFLSATGDLLALVTLALQVHALTGSAVAVSGLMAATLVPVIVLAPAAGLVADRRAGVRALVVASLAQAVVAAGLAFSGHLVPILVLSALLAAGNAFAQPAEFTLVPLVAGDRPLVEATGLVEAARYAGFAAGPALAALLATAGPRPALLMNAATFLAIAGVAAALRPRPAATPAGAGAASRDGALEGLGVIRRDPVLRVTVGAAVGTLLAVSVTPVVEVFYVRDVVGAGPSGYAVVVGAWMAGMVAGATVIPRRVPPHLVASGALVALVAQGAGVAGQTAWAVLPVAVCGFLLGGLGHGAKNVLLRVLLTVRVPVEARGRAFASYAAARNAAELCATAAAGLVVALLGARGALLVAGAAPALVAVAGLAVLRRSGTTAPDDVSGAPPGIAAAGRRP